MKVIKVSEIVKEILIADDHSRDNDELLMINVWNKQSSKISNKHYSFEDFSISFANGDLFKSESITRARRKLQEIHPELRGESYKARHDHSEIVKEDIKKIN